MDSYMEYMVTKRVDIKGYALRFLIVALALALMLVVFFVPALNMFSPFFIIGIGYGTWYLITSLYLEYEYIVTNDDLDVDKIIAKKKRKRMLSVNVKQIEKIAPVSPDNQSEFSHASIKHTVNAAAQLNQETTYYVLFEDQGKGKSVLFLDAPDEMIAMLKKYIPTKVTLRG